MTITLKPDVEEELAARAKAEGLSTEEFVNSVLENWSLVTTSCTE